MKNSRSIIPILPILVLAGGLSLPTQARAQISDVSDAVFSIIVPSAEAQVVDMGRIAVGAQRDSLIQPFVRNTGRARIRIDTLRITGTDASSFEVTAGKGPVYIPIAAGHAVGFTFRPLTAGVKSATIVVETQIDTMYYTIRGEAIEAQIALDALMIDFGAMPLGAFRDSTLVMVRNLGAGPLTVTDAEQGGPDLAQFSIIGGTAPFILPPFGTHEMTLRYHARKAGRSSGSIEFTVEGTPDGVTAQLFGEGLVRDAAATLSTDTLTAAPGEILSVPIRLRNAENVQFSGATAFVTELRYRAALLVPVGVTPKGRLEGDERVIPLENHPVLPDADGVLEYLEFMAVLGDAESTPLQLERSAAIGANFPVLELPGFFRLTDICREGGDRLFDASGTLRLEANRPNPFNTSTVIRFETIETGETQLFVSDMLGRRIATLHSGPLPAGAHEARFDAAALPSGQYLCILRTPTRTLQQRMLLIK